MLIVLGVVSMMGSVWLLFDLSAVNVIRSAGAVYTAYIAGSVALLVLAYRCFGGEF